MKTYHLIILVILFASCKTSRKAQVIVPHIDYSKKVIRTVDPNQPIPNYQSLSTFNGDTAKYLKVNFIDRQEAYINKKLDVLLKDMEVPITKFVAVLDQSTFKTSTLVYLNIDNYREQTKKIETKNEPSVIIINWKKPIAADSTIAIMRSTQGLWNAAAKQYFGNQTIGSIEKIIVKPIQ
ncbi:hypothetical protein ACFQ3S_17250 [Mucilaginibacter terrae]|uniref:hypothetical protein n=1 Tax=Mucilaginibacter terrae TaxID=1955052 RepID=UPI003642E2D3